MRAGEPGQERERVRERTSALGTAILRINDLAARVRAARRRRAEPEPFCAGRHPPLTGT